MNFRITLKLPLLAACIVFFVLPQVANAATAGPSVKWGTPVHLEVPHGKKVDVGLDAVSCPVDGKTEMCVVADETGYVWTSVAPTNKRAWHKALIDKTKAASLTGVSCPSAALCVAVDNQGELIYSKNPAGGAKYWSRPLRVDTTAASGGTTAQDGYAGFSGISCPTTTLCVAVDNAGQVITSTNPTGGATSDWTITALPNSPSLTSVSCFTAALCVIGGSQRYVSTTPTGAASAWTARGPIALGGTIASVDCQSLTLCVGVGFGDSSTALATATDNPTGGTSQWADTDILDSVPVATTQLLDTVACPLANLCVALDGADNPYTTTTPLTGAWTAVGSPRRKSVSTWSEVACDSRICVFGDSRGWAGVGAVRR